MMTWRPVGTGLLASLCFSASVLGQAVVRETEPSALYQIDFQPGDPIPGIGAMPAVRLPLECTEDGTMFISMVQPLGNGAPPRNLAPYSVSLLLTSISRSGEAHSFPLDQVPDLYDIVQISDYVSDSKVIFLLSAAHGSKQAPAIAGGNDVKTPVERSFYAVMFDRQGNYEKTVEVDSTLHVSLLGLFPSGTFLVYGADRTDHTPKLAMLKDDGTILKFLEVPKDGAPESAIGPKNLGGKGPAVYFAPAQFAGQGPIIYLLQNRTSFPLLEIDEAGAIRVIKPKLLPGTQIETLVPSDRNLYIRMKDVRDGAIYELNPQDGSILRRFRVGKNESGADVACVHEGKFLSFEHSGQRLVPLTGSAEPAAQNHP